MCVQLCNAVESLSDEPDPEEQEEGGETAPLNKTNEEDYEFVIEDDEELDEAALAARYRPCPMCRNLARPDSDT